MKLRTVVRDGLFLNWALPAAVLPPPPAPLAYEVHRHGGEGFVFASLVLFRQQGLHASGLPFVRFAYPQANVRLYVLDGEGAPAVWFLRMLVPGWVHPAARYLANQPTSPAALRFPRPSRQPAAESWRWRVGGKRSFSVTARRSAPGVGEGPRLGDWQATVRHLGDRLRGYAEVGESLRRIDAEHPSLSVWPVVAEVEDATLLEDCVALPERWPPLHSAWLAPEIPFVFALRQAPEIELGTGPIPQAAASSRNRL